MWCLFLGSFGRCCVWPPLAGFCFAVLLVECCWLLMIESKVCSYEKGLWRALMS